MIRKPIMSGIFYPKDKEELRTEISRLFDNISNNNDKTPVLGLIVPHAGYFYSGKCMAKGYAQIKSSAPDVYVILGTNHNSRETCVSDMDFMTPLGTARTDQKLVASLIKKGILLSNETHANEHSIEVQIPFIQAINSNALICPILIGNDYSRLAEALISALDETKLKPIFICSTDFTHWGKNYNYLPFKTDVLKNLYALDRTAIQLIIKKDVKGLEKFIAKTSATICGINAILALLYTLKQQRTTGELLDHYTSYDVLKNNDGIVGYAGIMFKLK